MVTAEPRSGQSRLWYDSGAMKSILAVAVAALALGFGLGMGLERTRQGREEARAADPDAASREPMDADAGADAPDAGELDAALGTIRDLEARLAALQAANPAGPPSAGREQAAGLRSRIPELLEKGDGAGLLALMKDLAALGPEGYEGAMEIAEIFRKAFGNGEEALGIQKVAFNKAFGGPMVPLMQWALDHPGNASPWFRARSVHMMYWVSDVDAGPIFIAALGREKDPAVAAAMAGYLQRLAKPEMAGTLAGAARTHAGDARTLTGVLGALVELKSPQSEAALRSLASSSNPKLRDAAALALIEHSPPAAGVMVTTTVPKLQAERVGIEKGDIIVSYDGKDVASMDQLRKLVTSRPQDTLVTVMVNRGGTVIPVQVKGGRIGIDGRYVRP